MPARSCVQRFLKTALSTSVGLLCAAVVESACARGVPVVEGAVGAAVCTGCVRATGWRLSVAYPVSLGTGGLTAGPMLGYADHGTVAEGPSVQRHLRHTRGPFAGVQVTLPLAEGWQAQARVGLGAWDTALVTTVHGLEAFQSSERHVGPLLGLGLSRALTPALALVASLDVGQHRFSGLPTVRPVLCSLGLAATF